MSARRASHANEQQESPLATTVIDTPIGKLTLTAEGDSLTRLWMEDQRTRSTDARRARDADLERHARLRRAGDSQGAPAGHGSRGAENALLGRASAQLRAYFAGERREFELPLALHGTEFQRRVWEALCEIPYGETISYGELARWVGKPGAARAVGLANNRNPMGIVVPCHRVIGADGSLTGYGGGLDRKLWLLRHEGAYETSAQGELELSAAGLR